MPNTNLRPDTLYTVTLDAAPFALVQAIDATDAVDLAVGLLSVSFDLPAANDHAATPPLLAAAEQRQRLAARAPTDGEKLHFARRRQAMGLPLAAVVIET